MATTSVALIPAADKSRAKWRLTAQTVVNTTASDHLAAGLIVPEAGAAPPPAFTPP